MSNKFRKPHTISYKNTNIMQYRQGLRGNSFGFRALEPFNLYKRQILQYKAIITKILKAQNKSLDQYYKGCFYNKVVLHSSVNTGIFPYNAETIKSQGSRMGKGKGAVDDYYFPVKAGFILFELTNVDYTTAERCAVILQYKFPVKIRVVSLTY